MKLRSVLLVVLLCVAVFITGASAHLALAGSNGQQIAIYCDPPSRTPIDRMVIDGYNQNGQHAIFWGTPSNAGSGYAVWGWWWKGSVTVTWHYVNGNYSRSTQANIPTRAGSDIYIVGSC